MLERMGGVSSLLFELVPNERSRRHNTDIEAGFEFIRVEGPRSNWNNRQLIWIKEQVASSSSPISGWKESTIERALKTLVDQHHAATVQKDYPLNLGDVSDWFLEGVLQHVIGGPSEHGLLMIGETGVGKTQFAQITAMAMSCYWINKDGAGEQAAFRTANDFDFFRFEAGSK